MVVQLTRPDQCLQWPQADWDLYERISSSFGDSHVFLTYFEGMMEAMTPSFIHDQYARRLYSLIKAIAEETNTPIVSAGSTTFRRKDQQVALEADESFYTVNRDAVVGKREIDLDHDPPPDLAIEIEVSHRLGVRREIYQRLGVPELWILNDDGLSILVLRDGKYHQVDRSPTFPQMTPQEIVGFVDSGIGGDETAWIRQFRKRVREIIEQ